jgi:hypothetical protein
MGCSDFLSDVYSYRSNACRVPIHGMNLLAILDLREHHVLATALPGVTLDYADCRGVPTTHNSPFIFIGWRLPKGSRRHSLQVRTVLSR